MLKIRLFMILYPSAQTLHSKQTATSLTNFIDQAPGGGFSAQNETIPL